MGLAKVNDEASEEKRKAKVRVERCIGERRSGFNGRRELDKSIEV